MCQWNVSGDFNKNCGCESESEQEAISKGELLIRLKACKKNLESELLMVKNKLKSEDDMKKP